MKRKYVERWEEIQAQMEMWWCGKNTKRPIMTIQVPKNEYLGISIQDGWAASSAGNIECEKMKAPTGVMEEREALEHWTDLETLIARYEKMYEYFYYTAETYPRFAANLGVGSLAVFLGCEPIFTKDTIWYNHFLENPETDKLKLDTKNKWLQWSLETSRAMKKYAKGEFLVGIPDITENIDILASLYGTEDLLYHMMDYPDEIKRLLCEIQDAWFAVYQMHYDIVCNKEGYSSFGPFQIWGKGKIAKLQCDVSATFSKDMFDEFALPYLKEQVEWLDKSMYHLDGADAVKHLDSVLSMEKLNALQWTPGAGEADGGDEKWDFIYEKALLKGKSIYALVAPENVERFVKRFGHKGVYISTRADNEEMAEMLVSLKV